VASSFSHRIYKNPNTMVMRGISISGSCNYSMKLLNHTLRNSVDLELLICRPRQPQTATDGESLLQKILPLIKRVWNAMSQKKKKKKKTRGSV
jgi:hypothetical protein